MGDKNPGRAFQYRKVQKHLVNLTVAVSPDGDYFFLKRIKDSGTGLWVVALRDGIPRPMVKVVPADYKPVTGNGFLGFQGSFQIQE